MNEPASTASAPLGAQVHKLDQLFFANSNYGRFADHQPTNTSRPPIMLDLPDLSGVICWQNKQAQQLSIVAEQLSDKVNIRK